ncbi:MAG: YicC family protein [Roseicyclus sp.]
MTGFATREGAGEGLGWTWELRGVNARGLDLRLRLPDGLGALEAPLRKAISGVLARGSVSLSLRFVRAGGPAGTGLDPAWLDTALGAMAEVCAAADRRNVALRPPSPAEILGLRGLSDAPVLPALPEPALLLAEADLLLEAFVAMRRTEGAALAAVLVQQIDRIEDLAEAAAVAADARAEGQADAFRAHLAKLLDASDLDEARLAQELALLAVKSDVTEEIDRLRAHVEAARALLAQGGPVGRKLDFLMQEFNREANTLCSKSGDAALTAIGLDLKLAIDQTREQVQNVE